MQLAKDLADLIHRYGPAMAAAAEAVLIPRYKSDDPRPDLSPLEACRTRNSGKPFQFYSSQIEKIAGTVAGLKSIQRVFQVCEMGCGKSPMSLAAAWLLLWHKPFRVIVMCPGHLVRKWRREVEWLIPNVQCLIIRHFTDLLKFQAKEKITDAPMVLVIGKETAKLGLDVDKPCAASRKMWVQLQIHSQDDMLPGDKHFHRVSFEAGDDTPKYAVTRLLKVACCPRCGELVKNGGADKEEPLAYADYIAGNEPVTCTACGDRLLTNARGFRKNPHIDRYIQRKMRGVFDLMIADEVHELSAAETIQGNTFGTIASACRYTIALTGTLIGGKASDLHAPLWRLGAGALNARGFNIQGYKDSRISAIARNEKSFVRRYGVLEHQVIRSCRNEADDYHGNVHRGACGRRKSYKTDERPKPGISPDLFNHFLIDRAVFMELNELGPALPSMERILVPVKMSDELSAAYGALDKQLREAIKQRSHGGKGPPGLAATRVQTLDAYLDKPWGWDPIKAPAYDDDGNFIGKEAVAWPSDLGDGHCDAKDEMLVEIVRGELKAGRRCAIYPQFTGVHDVRPKILELLNRAGVRALMLPDTVKPEAREDWIERHTGEMEVLITHPKRVMTGLDLIGFPTLVWYQTGYSTHVLRQASARARRPTQTKPCKVIFLYYAGTIQEQALALMGEKEAASQALEGVFDCRALRALMNGGKDDDILAALANTLDTDIERNAKAAWERARVVSESQALPPKSLTHIAVTRRRRAREVQIPKFIQLTLF